MREKTVLTQVWDEWNDIDVKYATRKGIPVTNTPGVLTNAVTEHAFSLIMSVTRRIVEADRFTRARKYKGWEPLLLLGSELKGKTLGIIGLGRIGIRIAEITAKGMGMNVVYNDIRRNKKFEKRYRAKYVSKERLLKSADVITLHVPLLPTTRHMIGGKEFKMMKKSSYLINTSRGPIVDEKALVRALRRKEIAGAALDVFEFEPKLAPGLAKLDNVVLTPHMASATFETRSAMAEIAAKNIIAVIDGKKPPAIVNKEVL